MKKGITLLFFIFSIYLNAQVGIGNTNPQATLDISASNTTSPANNDGILIPRVSAFPSAPGATRDGMLIFYTGTESDGKGFYYWDQSITDWVKIVAGSKNTLDEAYDEGGAGVGRIILADNGAVQIDGEDGFQITGTFGNGDDISLSGGGTRMFFNPKKSAFRAGRVSGNQWNNANVGNYSFAVGQNNTSSGSNSSTLGRSNMASGAYSNAFGRNNTASGAYSNAFGRSNIASGQYAIAGAISNTASGTASIAIGNANNASGDFSVAFGMLNTASGLRSFVAGSTSQASGFASSAFGFNNTVSGLAASVFGNANTAPSAYEFVVGTFNTNYTPANTNNSNVADRVFTVGNGLGNTDRSNALTIYKSGRMNINDAYNMPLTDGSNGQVMTTNGSGSVSWQDIPVVNNDAWFEANTVITPNSINDDIYTNGNVGIGFDNPDARLYVRTNSGGSSAPHIKLVETSANDGARIQFSNSIETNNQWTLFGRADNMISLNTLNFSHSSAGDIMEIKGSRKVEINGQLGVNVNNPTFAIELPNNFSFGTGRARANAWTTYSDSRVKSNQKVLKSGLQIINQMAPKTYFHHNSNVENGKLQISKNGENTLGFIAQELYKVLPEAVQKPEDENKTLWSVNYNKVIPVAVKAIQELNTKVETLEVENTKLKQQLALIQQLEARLIALENNDDKHTGNLESAKTEE